MVSIIGIVVAKDTANRWKQNIAGTAILNSIVSALKMCFAMEAAVVWCNFMLLESARDDIFLLQTVTATASLWHAQVLRGNQKVMFAIALPKKPL